MASFIDKGFFHVYAAKPILPMGMEIGRMSQECIKKYGFDVPTTLYMAQCYFEISGIGLIYYKMEIWRCLPDPQVLITCVCSRCDPSDPVSEQEAFQRNMDLMGLELNPK